jgi:hypothetical protein
MGFQKPVKKFDANSDAARNLTDTVKTTGIKMVAPVRIGLKRDGSDIWTLPIEPLVSIEASKTIVRRSIAKARGVGTVKEQWNQDDYSISIEGTLIGTDGKFPETDFNKLQNLLKAGQSLVIQSLLFDLLGIGQLCIEKWNYPHTPGLENQNYTFSGYSDQDFELV